MRVLIVAKTHMQRHACVGGISLDPDRSLRLMQAHCSPQPGDTRYEVGDLWQLECDTPGEIRPPHFEDVHVLKARKIGEEVQMKRFLLERISPGVVLSTRRSRASCASPITGMATSTT
jgi:hypothetical protein